MKHDTRLTVSQYNRDMQEGTTQPRGRRWKRKMVIALLLFIGGAVVNVAVAWGICWQFRDQIMPQVHALRDINSGGTMVTRSGTRGPKVIL